MGSTTVRIPKEDRDVLRLLAEKTGKTSMEILHRAIEDFRRKCFLDEANRAYAALRRKPKAWEAELKERKAWAATIGDGLEGR